jgi:hypothetical protein
MKKIKINEIIQTYSLHTSILMTYFHSHNVNFFFYHYSKIKIEYKTLHLFLLWRVILTLIMHNNDTTPINSTLLYIDVVSLLCSVNVLMIALLLFMKCCLLVPKTVGIEMEEHKEREKCPSALF